MIYTFNTDLKKRLVAFAKKHPDLCMLTVADTDFGSVTYEIQMSRISTRPVTPFSEERPKAASERAKKHGSNNRKKGNNQL